MVYAWRKLDFILSQKTHSSKKWVSCWIKLDPLNSFYHKISVGIAMTPTSESNQNRTMTNMIMPRTLPKGAGMTIPRCGITTINKTSKIMSSNIHTFQILCTYSS